MITPDKLDPIRQLLQPVNQVLIVVGKDADLDQLASASALCDALQTAGKQVYMASPKPPSAELLAQLNGENQVTDSLGHRDLTISFEYRPESVDKVSYHIDDQQQRFYLVIKPQKGQAPLTADSVQYSYTGADADLMILIGVSDIESLEQLYFGYETLYQNTPLISLNSYETPMGTVKVDITGHSCYSEAVANLVQHLGFAINQDSATNLLTAIETETNHFVGLNTTADTFEQVATLLRQGARRSYRHQKPKSFADSLAATAEKQPASEKSSTNSRKKRPPKSQEPETGSLQYQPSGLGPGGGG